MHLRQLAKDPESGTIGCPSIHLDADSGDLVVQGQGVDLAHLPPNPLPGELAVRIAPGIVRAAARELGWLP